MADFKVSDRMLELTFNCKRRIVEPSVYDDVIERYDKLYNPKNTGGSRLACAQFNNKIRSAREFYDAISDTNINLIALCLQDIRSIFKDERQENCVIYPIDMVLMVILLAKLSGFNTAKEIASYYKSRYLQLICMLPDLPGPEHMLSASSINRVMRLFTTDEINKLLFSYFKPHPKLKELILENEEQRPRPEHASRPTVGFDGQEITKTFVRGETSRRKKAAIGVTVYDCSAKKVLAYQAVKKKNNEADAFLQMLPNLSIQGSIVCADALNTRGDISTELNKRGIDYLFNIKDNAGNKELRGHIEAIFSREYAKGDKSEMKTRSYIQKEHGRIDQYTVNTLPATLLDNRIKNPHQEVKTLVEYIKESSYIINGKVVKTTKNTRWYISSLEFSDENADQILYCILDYWSLEQHHSRLDDPKVFNQDDTQSCSADYSSSLLGINKVSYNILSWIRQKLIKESTKKSYRPSYSMVQDMLAEMTVFEVFEYLAEYYRDVNFSEE